MSYRSALWFSSVSPLGVADVCGLSSIPPAPAPSPSPAPPVEPLPAAPAPARELGADFCF